MKEVPCCMHNVHGFLCNCGAHKKDPNVLRPSYSEAYKVLSNPSPRAEAIQKVLKKAEDEYLIHQVQAGAGGRSECDCPFCRAVRELKDPEP